MSGQIAWNLRSLIISAQESPGHGPSLGHSYRRSEMHLVPTVVYSGSHRGMGETIRYTARTRALTQRWRPTNVSFWSCYQASYSYSDSVSCSSTRVIQCCTATYVEHLALMSLGHQKDHPQPTSGRYCIVVTFSLYTRIKVLYYNQVAIK